MCSVSTSTRQNCSGCVGDISRLSRQRVEQLRPQGPSNTPFLKKTEKERRYQISFTRYVMSALLGTKILQVTKRLFLTSLEHDPIFLF